MNNKGPINPITMVDDVTDTTDAPETKPDSSVENTEESEVEFTREQEERLDEIYNAAWELCKVMTENPDLPFDQSYIGEVAESAAAVMVQHWHKVRFPAIVTDDDGNETIQEYYGDDYP